MSLIASILAAVAQPIADIIENAISDNYDKEKELQAMLRLGRAVADARVQHLLQQKK